LLSLFSRCKVSTDLTCHFPDTHSKSVCKDEYTESDCSVEDNNIPEIVGKPVVLCSRKMSFRLALKLSQYYWLTTTTGATN